MEVIASLPGFNQDYEAKTTFEWFNRTLGTEEGTCFYKYPFVGGIGSPDLVFLTRNYHPIAIKCFDYESARIKQVEETFWVVESHSREEHIDSPSLQADDLAVDLTSRFSRVRQLRTRLVTESVAALPRTVETDFFKRFGLLKLRNLAWAGGDAAESFIKRLEEPLNDTEWRLARSILQTAFPLTKTPGGIVRKATTQGAAIRMLDSNIALLDDQQMKVAIQIPPGPQRIRGLEGTGK